MSQSQAVFQHPVIAIQNGVQNFSFKSKPVTLRLEPGEFEKVQKKIQITLVWLSLASCHQLGGSPACEKKVASNCSR